MTNRFFKQQESEVSKSFIAPDYSDEIGKEDSPKEDDLSDEESISFIDEGKDDEEEIISNPVTNESSNNMIATNGTNNAGTTSTPFGTQSPATPQWGNTQQQTSVPFTTWGNSGNVNQGTSFWNNNNQQRPIWGAGGNNYSTAQRWGQPVNQQPNNPSFQQGQFVTKSEIDRTKKVIVTDFLDIIAETYDSNGISGLIPRDVYDLKPRFDVWNKIAAFNPEKIYILAPINLVSGTAGISAAWEQTFGYFCVCISSFLRIPFQSCQVIAQNTIGTPKSETINSIINNKEFPINKKDVVLIGVNSGFNNQSNRDSITANECGIDYVDLFQLLNNMY